MKPLYTASYDYTPELIHSFCRIHLWYHRRQHPLFLKIPGAFLAVCLIWRLISLLAAGADFGAGDILALILIALFTFVLIWMGFIHPYVFEKTIKQAMLGPAGKNITIAFYDDHFHAESSLVHADYAYEQVGNSYVTVTCLYLYVNKDQAVLVPVKGIPEDVRDGFSHFISKKLSGKLSRKMHLR